MTELRRRTRLPVVDGPRRVFIDRGMWGAERNLANRDPLVETLQRRGFQEIYPERETPQRLSTLLSCAEVCVGVEGSALTHAALLMPEGATIIALQPPRRFAGIIKLYAECANLKYGYSVGEQTNDGFNINIGRLLRTLDICGIA